MEVGIASGLTEAAFGVSEKIIGNQGKELKDIIVSKVSNSDLVNEDNIFEFAKDYIRKNDHEKYVKHIGKKPSGKTRRLARESTDRLKNGISKYVVQEFVSSGLNLYKDEGMEPFNEGLICDALPIDVMFDDEFNIQEFYSDYFFDVKKFWNINNDDYCLEE